MPEKISIQLKRQSNPDDVWVVEITAGSDSGMWEVGDKIKINASNLSGDLQSGKSYNILIADEPESAITGVYKCELA